MSPRGKRYIKSLISTQHLPVGGECVRNQWTMKNKKRKRKNETHRYFWQYKHRGRHRSASSLGWRDGLERIHPHGSCRRWCDRPNFERRACTGSTFLPSRTSPPATDRLKLYTSDSLRGPWFPMRSGIPQPPASWSPDDITHTHTHTHKTRMYKKGKLSKKKKRQNSFIWFNMPYKKLTL